MDEQTKQELREIAFQARNAGRNSPPTKYVTTVMLSALDMVTGDSKQTLEVLKQVHESNVESAPDELKAVLSVVFSEFFRGLLATDEPSTKSKPHFETDTMQ